MAGVRDALRQRAADAPAGPGDEKSPRHDHNATVLITSREIAAGAAPAAKAVLEQIAGGRIPVP
ncbi:hypothetical protein GCM10018954_099820 [Kutzneria kofuensis]